MTYKITSFRRSVTRLWTRASFSTARATARVQFVLFGHKMRSAVIQNPYQLANYYYEHQIKSSERVGNVLSRSKGQCSRSFKSNSVRPFLRIEPPLFALPLLHAPNRNSRVGAAASDSTHTESVAPTADAESPPLAQVLQVEATAIVTVPMR